MPGRFIVKHWLLRNARLSGVSLVDSQISQAYARIGFASAGLIYMMLHAADFSAYKTAFLISGTLYYLINLISIPLIRKKPLSVSRCLLIPVSDVAIVSFSMLIDGGQSSGLFFLFLLIILGNGLRFGNPLLIYTQCLSLFGLLIMLLYANIHLQAALDFSILFWQIISLLAIPFYVYLIGRRVEDAFKAKKEAEQSAHNLINQGPLPIITFDIDKSDMPRILFANSAVSETFHINHSLLENESADTLVLPEDRKEMIHFCRNVFRDDSELEQSTVHNLYIRSRSIGGKVLKLQCTAIRLRLHDRWVGVCFMLDISAREDIQEELESIHKQGYLTTMVAGIVHDFRNVLTNMIGYAEILQMSIRDEVAKQPLEAIIAAGDRGSELISHLLKLSKNGDNDPLPEFTAADQIDAPLEHIIGLARLQMPPHIQLDCHIEKPLHDVAISIIEIEQILMNLINNSALAMKQQGEIRVSLFPDAEHRLGADGYPSLCIRVSDNGPGIARQDLENVFKPFWTSRIGSGGTGLGLTMVQRIIKRNGGKIEVESEPDKETVFTIHLPPYIQPIQTATEESAIGSEKNQPTAETDKSEADTTANPAAEREISQVAATPAAQQSSDNHDGYHILLVDDVPDILKIHQTLLSRMHHTTMVAENGRQALELFSRENEPLFDLIITDFRMPVMDGVELVEQLRNSGSDIPVLMITAFGEDQQLQRAVELGVKVINKPVSMEKFLTAINDLMQHRSR